MKLSFTTLGCPDWTLDELLKRAPGYGFDGIDFRFLKGTTELWRLPEFTSELSQTVRLLGEAGLAVTGLSSSVRVHTADVAAAQSACDELSRMVELAHGLGAPLVRVFPGNSPEVALGGGLLSEMQEQLSRYAAIGAEAGVGIAVETHDGCSGGAQIKRLLDAAGHPAGVYSLWDIHHPLRHCGETPQDTAMFLRETLGYVHWKDSRLLPGGDAVLPNRDHLCLPGEGDLPMPAFIDALREIGYDGAIAFEWEKPWVPDLPPAEIAFPRFVESMRMLLAAPV